MGATIVRYKAKADRAYENQQYIEKVFDELAATAPEGLRYATFRLADGVSFVHVAFVDTPDGTNPLSNTPAFAAFVAGIADRCEEPPVALEATVVGSYNF